MGIREQYYTPVEFAKMFNIDKQTLIYYDNQGIFAPAYKKENGYRYYSADQIVLFSILLALRKLNIQGHLLAEYNKSPSNEKLTEMLKDKIFEYNETVQSLSQKIECLQSKIPFIQKSNNYPINRIMLIPHHQIYCQRGIIVTENTSLKDALLASSPLISTFATNLLTHQLQLSFMPIFNNLEDLNQPYRYRIVLLTNDANLFTNPLVYSPALYLTIIIEDDFHQNVSQYVTMMKEFMGKVGLTYKPLAFITPWRAFSCLDNEKRNLTKIELNVSYE